MTNKTLLLIEVNTCVFNFLALNNTSIRFKEARAGCSLKNRLRKFLFEFMLFQVYLCKKKNIPHRDCSETGAISKYVSKLDFFV